MHRIPHLLPPAALLLLAACGDDSNDLAGPTTGSIQVNVTSSGEPPDPTGYTIAVDGGSGQAITAGGTITITDVSAGAHTVMLGDLAQNCSTGTNPQTVTVSAGETAQVAFAVLCTSLPATVATLPATGVTASSVVVNGTVNPNGSPTTWTFELGTTTALGEQCAGDGTPLTGTADLPVSCSVTGRPVGQTIYYRLVAENAGGRAEGEILSAATIGPAGSAPAITSVTFPVRVINDPGTSVDLTIGFTDADGDIAVLRFEEVSDPNDAVTIDPETADVRALAAGRTSGTFTIQGAYNCEDSDGCVTGPVTVRLRLRDEAGHESQPSDLSFEIVN